MDNPSKVMLMSERGWKALSILLLIWAIIATTLWISGVSQVKTVKSQQEITVNLGFKYENGTVIWHNNTRTIKGSTLLDLTKIVANVNYTTYPSGSFVNSINGVKNKKPYYWIWWYWSKSGWILGPVAADKYVVSNGETLLWYYENTSSYPPSKP